MGVGRQEDVVFFEKRKHSLFTSAPKMKGGRFEFSVYHAIPHLIGFWRKGVSEGVAHFARV